MKNWPQRVILSGKEPLALSAAKGKHLSVGPCHISVNWSQCERDAGQPQGMALL